MRRIFRLKICQFCYHHYNEKLYGVFNVGVKVFQKILFQKKVLQRTLKCLFRKFRLADGQTYRPTDMRGHRKDATLKTYPKKMLIIFTENLSRLHLEDDPESPLYASPTAYGYAKIGAYSRRTTPAR